MSNLAVKTQPHDRTYLKSAVATTAVVLAVLASPAHAAPLAEIDVSDIITSIGVIVAAITSIGMGALSIAILIKAFRYIRSAF